MSDLLVYKKIDDLIKNLSKCTTRTQIDSIFSDAGITDYNERIQLLDKCMGFKRSFGTPEKVSIESEYDFECATFEDGTWRMLS